MEALKILKSLGAIKELESLGGEIFLVGGIVRDHFINKKSKDIDIIVRLVDEETIKTVLEKHGTLASGDEDGKTGASFGVFKFFPNEIKLDEAIDIALPRTERLMTDSEFKEAVAKGELKAHNRHKAFVVTSDHMLEIEEDLKRRDFTINSIAMTLLGIIIDPFNGMDDLKNKILRATSTQAFSDDPLRMMRAIQFGSRLGFEIEHLTWDMIISNREDIKHITGERIITELDKIFEKGNIALGFQLLIKSGLGFILFPNSFNFPFEKTHGFISLIKTRADFFSFLVKDGDEFKKTLKGDVDTAKGIDSIRIIETGLLESLNSVNKTELRHLVFKALNKSKSVLDSGLVNSNPELFNIISEFIDGDMPKSSKELAVNGHDLLELGLIGADIGKAQKNMISAVFTGEVKNEKESLFSFLEQ